MIVLVEYTHQSMHRQNANALSLQSKSLQLGKEILFITLFCNIIDLRVGREYVLPNLHVCGA